MTSIEISKQITESILQTIGNRIDEMRRERAKLDPSEWELVLNGVVNALDKTIDDLVESKLINANDYDKLDDTMDVLAELKYTYFGGKIK